MLLDHPVISRSFFHPRPSRAEPTLRVEVPGATLGCFVHRPYPDRGTLLYFHGNGELAAEYAAGRADFFLDMGVNVCFAEYRGYGASTGEAALGAMLPDGEAIVRALGVRPDRVVAFGRSLGCIYAIELARRLPALAGLVLESGRAEMLEAFESLWDDPGQLPCTAEELAAEVRTHLNQQAALRGYAGRLLVLHTENDQFFDRSNAERFHEWGGGDDKRLVVFARGNHNTILAANVLAYSREVKSFLRRAGVTADRPTQP
jgi:pimeloyl-ACP methyl ester carboxylesterase